MKVAVGSTNITKIESVKSVFEHYFKKVNIIGKNVSSGVSDQPMSEKEMYKGALTRAKTAINMVKDAEYGVGIEGGLQKYSYGWFEHSLVVIVNSNNEIGIGSSGGLVLPDKVIKFINTGKNLEQVIDEIFGTHEIGKGIGMFGIMTNGYISRTEGVRHGIAFALARFLHKDIYNS